ncbi:hypothetical protein QEZ54_21540 [Catellatospora sp. KI3]|uniref:hypothetical protein n=1 Tax=Catellatospora sp. KI3 TaxID=3041620 RepID=UPI0024822BC1|nr:hypothetical protein [Catellatospora sp. KI3]MDI1463570.1 hypothetical protein [Catellatospora sp. KI3]
MHAFHRSKLLTALAAVVLGASVSLAAASPAQAVSGQIVTVGWSTLTGSEPIKTANALCPAGKVVLGGGADIVDGGNEVRLTSIEPTWAVYPTHSYYAVAMEDGGYAGNWTVYAWAICGNPVPGWEVVSTYKAAASTTSDTVQAVAVCPAGKKVIGTGGVTIGGYRFRLVAVHPTYDHVLVGVSPDETASGSFGARAYAICTDPIGQVLVDVDSGYSSSNKAVTAACPAGTTVHGAGAFINGGTVWRQVHLNRIGFWGPGALSGADLAAHEDETGYAGNWHVMLTAICAP